MWNIIILLKFIITFIWLSWLFFIFRTLFNIRGLLLSNKFFPFQINIKFWWFLLFFFMCILTIFRFFNLILRFHFLIIWVVSYIWRMHIAFITIILTFRPLLVWTLFTLFIWFLLWVFWTARTMMWWFSLTIEILTLLFYRCFIKKGKRIFLNFICIKIVTNSPRACLA